MTGKTWENLENESNAPSDILKKMQKEKTGTLKEAIKDIEIFIETRNKLHDEMCIDIETIKSTINNLIAELGRENSKDIMLKQIELEILKIQEKLNRWRDVALLKKELREHMKEFREHENKANIIDEILEEGV